MTTNDPAVQRLNNSKRQSAYKERMRKAGFQQVTLWIQPQRRETLKRLSTRLRKADDVELLAIHRTLARLENRA